VKFGFKSLVRLRLSRATSALKFSVLFSHRYFTTCSWLPSLVENKKSSTDFSMSQIRLEHLRYSPANVVSS
jgi:hypothetical protein